MSIPNSADLRGVCRAPIAPGEFWQMFWACVLSSAGNFACLALKKFLGCRLDGQWKKGAWDRKTVNVKIKKFCKRENLFYSCILITYILPLKFERPFQWHRLYKIRCTPLLGGHSLCSMWPSKSFQSCHRTLSNELVCCLAWGCWVSGWVERCDRCDKQCTSLLQSVQPSCCQWM